MKSPIPSKPFTGLLAALFLIGLAGCKEDIALLNDSGKIVGTGTLKITANFPSPARLMLDGKEYTGYWNEQKIYEEDLARSRRLIGDRALAAYEIGNDPVQLKHGYTNLTAGDGSEIQCDFYYRSQPVTGSCEAGNKVMKLILQPSGHT